MRSTLAALALVVALGTLAGCSEPDDEAQPPPETDTPSASPEIAPVLMIGEHPYAAPCELFGPEAATRMLPLTEQGSYSERGRMSGVSPAEVRKMEKSLGGAKVSSSCDYLLGDAGKTQVKLTVDQYATEKLAHRQWKQIADYGSGAALAEVKGDDAAAEAMRELIRETARSVGGVRLPGIDDRVLWRAGDRQFMTQSGEVVLWFAIGKQYGLTPTLTTKGGPRAERVLLEAVERYDGGDFTGAPAPGHLAEGSQWPPFLAPCDLLDGDASRAIVGRRLEEFWVSSTSADPDVTLGSDSPAGRSQDNSCEREGHSSSQLFSTRVHVQYVAPGDSPEKVLDSYLGNKLFDDPQPTKAQRERIRQAFSPGNLADADASYLLMTNTSGFANFTYYAIVDDYVLEIEGLRPAYPRRKDDYTTRSVDTLSLKTGAEMVLANLRAAMEEAD